jgi:hypothetical protein
LYKARRTRSPFAFRSSTDRALHFANDAKALVVNEAIDQTDGSRPWIFIENKHRHVFYVVVERIAERDHLDSTAGKRKKKRKREKRWSAEIDRA